MSTQLVDVVQYNKNNFGIFYYKGKEEKFYDNDKAINKITINSINEITPFLINDLGYHYRGQASSDWPLKTSIERFFENKKILISKSEIEKRILEKYQSESSVFSNELGYDPKTQNVLDSISDIQHYGGPTRFLDWTSSFNIALFFAVFNNKNENASVFCLRNVLLTTGTFDINDIVRGMPMAPDVLETLPEPKDKTKLLNVYTPTRKNNRIQNQKGYFIYPGSVETSFEEALKYSLNTEIVYNHEVKKEDIEDALLRSCLIKVIIPRNMFSEIMKYLKKAGISMKTLFPDYYGAIQSLYEIETDSF